MPAPRELHCLMVHGVGQQSSGFAATAIKALRGALRDRGVRLCAREVLWAPLADQFERTFLQSAERHGSRGNAAQRLVVGTLADALAYQSNTRLREQIAYLLDWEYTQLPPGSVHLFAHSLGGLLVTDWLRTRKNVRPVSLTTLGCNLGLFNLGKPFDCPSALTNDRVWRNAYYPSDLLGYPLQTQDGFSQVQDLKLPHAGFFRVSTFVPGLSHLDYWTDKRLWAKKIPEFLV